MEIQQKLFEEIKKKLPPNLRLADVIGDLLKVSSDSTYRRIRGEKELSLGELEVLCSHFKISVDQLLNQQTDTVPFAYNPLSFSSPNVYEDYMARVSKIYSNLLKSDQREFKITAQDIPIFHFLPYPELTLFKVFSLYRSLTSDIISYEAFVKTLNVDNLKECYKAIEEAFLQIPSTEIWSSHTIEPIVNLLSYYYDLNSFESKEMALLLGNQLLCLVGDIEQKTQAAAKVYKGKSTDFNFYFSPVDMQNDFIIAKAFQNSTTSIKLYTINAVFTTDKAFNEETEKWIDNIKAKSSMLSGTSERERFQFFNQLKIKVQNLIQQFE